MPVQGFHGFYQPTTRKNLRMHKSKRDISDQRKNLTRFIIRGKLKASGVELTVEKAVKNSRRARGGGPGHPTEKVELSKSRPLGRLVGR